MKRRIANIIFFGTALLVLSGCHDATTKSENETCIQPPFKLAIPQFVEGAVDGDELIPPGNGWEEVTQIPEGYERSGDLYFSDGRIWVKVWPPDPTYSDDSYSAIGAYHIKDGTWKIYDEIAGYPKMGPYRLVAALAGSIYGLDYADTDGILIAKYDETANEFQPVYQNTKPNISYKFKDGLTPMVDDLGNIWLNLWAEGDKNGLYHFNPDTKQLIYSQPEGLEYVEEMVLAPNKVIYMIAKTRGSNDYHLYAMDPQTGSGSANIINIEVEGYDYLYIDRESNLWISDKSFRKISETGEWGTEYEVIRSPVFISSNSMPWDKYKWVRPYKTFQSSDGTYWFTASTVGTISLDKESGEWCLFTNGVSAVIEDDDKNVWMIIKNTLYKKQLD